MQLNRRVMLYALAPVVLAAIPGTYWLTGRRAANENRAEAQSLRILVDLSTRRLKLYDSDTLVYQYDISVGSPRYPTPPGRYHIRRIVWNPAWKPPESGWARRYSYKPPGHPANPMKVVKIFFREPDFYIHGTGEIYSLGHAMSHGCLRMDPDHAAEVAKFVMEHGGQAREENWFWRIVHLGRTKTIYLDRPVPMTVQG